MSHSRRDHWERVHRGKGPGERSWFQPRPDTSLALIEQTGCGPGARVIDVGGGTSHLVDELLERGFEDVTVLDVSPAALDEARQRLGTRAAAVRWIDADITGASLPGRFDVWHDRAVFHFLTAHDERAAYVRLLEQSLAPGGHAIIATFAEDGPTRCSGLPVVRYSPASLGAELGEGFELVDTRRELHRTPAGKPQSFVYCLFRSRPAGKRND